MLRIVDEELFKAYKDASHFDAIVEEVYFPTNAEEVSLIVKDALDKGKAVYVFGAGSGLVGSSNPFGGIVIDLILMDSFEVYEDDMYVIAEPTAKLPQINSELKKHGLWIPVDPGSYELATVGGMVSTNASGLRAVKYGSIANYVRALELVDGIGRRYWLGNPYVRRSSVTPLLQKLVVGSEGLFGIITRVVLEALPLPEHRESVVIEYDNEMNALREVPKIVRLMPSALEFLDEECSRLLGYDKPILIVEFDGVKAEVEYKVKVMEKRVEGRVVNAENIWIKRKMLGPLLSKIKGARTDWDLSVPISKLPYVVKRVRELSKLRNLELRIFGHVGDGILHLTYLHEPSEWKEVEEKVGEIVCSVIREFGGSISGEHGVGLAKLKRLSCEPNYPSEVIRDIKRLFDPAIILNPGKKVLL